MLCLLTTSVTALFPVPESTFRAEEKERIPHNQSKPPGPALSPQEAMEKMQVPPGFHVELVASEPDLVNPVAMTFDERGRVWVTESLEYPRLSPGPGQDRIKILEDTDHDGRMDTVKVFAEGLNIPSGIAIGHGGVWVANAPDILLLRDTNGDDRADQTEVVVTGFGRDDTHELPNSLTWGPDGWLYGLNGVFNRSQVRDPVSGKDYRFTCALFRIHPRTHEFQIFCEGTSNPWGIAWNSSGDAFVSACVIDHLWHLAETAYYHRQGGPYPPFTWKAESIVRHKHQQAAYCGITCFDSDAYPAEYRNLLMMGNIHGGCINAERLEEFGATYTAKPTEDFLTANDAWFMPVVQKTGPDGCLWILDWYDRYHCYQDARRDSEGLDRLKGRLYRVRHEQSPKPSPFDLNQESDDQLMERLRSENVFFRESAQRILAERNNAATNERLLKLALNPDERIRTRLHSFWTRISAAPLNDAELETVLKVNDPDLRSWAVRTAGNQQVSSAMIRKLIAERADDPHPRVRLQVAVAARKLNIENMIPVLTRILFLSEDDPLTPRVIWQNLHHTLEHSTAEFSAALEQNRQSISPSVASQNAVYPKAVLDLLPRAADRILAAEKPSPAAVVQLVRALLKSVAAADAGNRCLQMLTERIRSGELNGDQLTEIRQSLNDDLDELRVQGPETPFFISAVELAAASGNADAVSQAIQEIARTESHADKLRLLNSVITAGSAESLNIGLSLLKTDAPVSFQHSVVQAIARIRSDQITPTLIRLLTELPPEVQPTLMESVSDRADSSLALMKVIASGKIPASVMNANQARKMLNRKNPELTDLVHRHWGTVQNDRDPARAELISRMRNTLRTANGSALNGQAVFRRVCGQCHRIYGQGAEVGPDITRNGRASFEQLLSSVFDPSLVIGASYQAQTVITRDGRIVTGLPVEDSPARIVLRVQGDKQEIIARENVEESVRSPLSLMPEGLEKQLTPEELHDLFAFLTLNRPPDEANAEFIPGARILPRRASDPSENVTLIQQLLPDYQINGSGKDGVELIPNYHGRPAVRTHPLSRDEPSILSAKTVVPAGDRVVLRVSAGSHDDGDWLLVVRVNGKTIRQTPITAAGNSGRWHDVDIDVSEFAGSEARIDLLNSANHWKNEHAFWNAAEFFVSRTPESLAP